MTVIRDAGSDIIDIRYFATFLGIDNILFMKFIFFIFYKWRNL